MTPALPRTGSALLRHALALAACGWHVFPCAIGGKQPALQGNWQHLATTNRARIHRWWTHAPFNIGIACGPSGLVVIDLDIPKDDGDTAATGMESLTELCQLHGQPYPDDTFAVTTPRGTHLYFQAPASPVRNSASRLGPLIDIRGAGGYVVAPGSRVGGRAYEVADAARPAPLPGWIASLLEDRPATAAARQLPAPGTPQAIPYVLAALRDETARVATARPSTRNDTLNRAAFSLGQLVAANLLPAVAVMTALANAAERCGLPGDEAHRTIRSGMASGVRHPRNKGLGRQPDGKVFTSTPPSAS
jgi:hypothetical protein